MAAQPPALKVSSASDTSQTLIINVAGQDRRFIHTFGTNAEFCAADIPLERVAHSQAHAMARDRLTSAAVSITTLDRTLARKMEPRAATPERRKQ